MASELYDALAARVGRGEYPGLVWLIARGGEVTSEAIGVTGFGDETPMRRDTPFRIASMTKPVIAAATLMLAEDDLLDLEEPVTRILPELAGQRVLTRPDAPLDETEPLSRPVTVEDLLTFTFGFGAVQAGDEMDPPYPIVRAWQERQLEFGAPHPRSPHTPDEWIRLFGELPLVHQPGSMWMYNAGTQVLSVLLARASGRPLGELLHDRLFAPLGMRHTGFFLPIEQARRLPRHYVGDRTEVPNLGPEFFAEEPTFPSGSGGLASTADDYLAFATMLLNGGVHGGTRLLPAAAVKAMTTNHLTPAQIETGGMILGGSGWGYGLGVRDTGRYGWSGGYGTTWFNDPESGTVAILLGQVSDLLWNGTIDDFNRLAV